MTSLGNIGDDDNIINPGLGLKTPNSRSKPSASVQPILVSEPDIITIPDQPIQQHHHHQQDTEVVTISDEDDDDSLESILKESCSYRHHLSSLLCKWKRSNFWEKINGI